MKQTEQQNRDAAKSMLSEVETPPYQSVGKTVRVKWGNATGYYQLDRLHHEIYEGVPEWLDIVGNMVDEGGRIIFPQGVSEKTFEEKVKSPLMIMILERVLKTFDNNKNPDLAEFINQCINLWQRNDLGSEKFIFDAYSIRDNGIRGIAEYRCFGQPLTKKASYALNTVYAAFEVNNVQAVQNSVYSLAMAAGYATNNEPEDCQNMDEYISRVVMMQSVFDSNAFVDEVSNFKNELIKLCEELK